MATYRLTPDPIKARGDIVVGDPAERRRDRLLLGRLAESGPARNLWLDISGEQVVAIFGKRGTGKSYTLGVIVEGLGSGAGEKKLSVASTPRGALVLDIMDIFWTSTLPLRSGAAPELTRQYELMRSKGFTAEAVGVDVWIPAGFQNQEIDPSVVHALRISPSDMSLDDWGALFEFDIYGEPRGMLLADVVQHTAVTGYDVDGVGRVQAVSAFGMQDMLDCLRGDTALARDYQDVTIRAVRQRLTSYASLDLFQGTGTPLSALIIPFRSAVLMLGRLPDALKQVVVAVLTRGILRDRRDSSFAQKRLDLDTTLSPEERTKVEAVIQKGLPRTWVLMDEAHVLAGANERTVAAEALIKFAKEGRNYGLSLAVATQQPSALDQRLLSQVETLICHQLTSPQDSATAAKAMRSPVPETVEVDESKTDIDGLLRRLGQGEALFSSGNAPSLQRGVVAAIRPRVTAHGGYEA